MASASAGWKASSVTSPETVAAEALRRLGVRMRAIESPAGEMPVVIAAGEGGIMIHEAVGHGLEADFNLQEYQRLQRQGRRAGRQPPGDDLRPGRPRRRQRQPQCR